MSETWQAVSTGMADAVAAVSQSTVRVDARKRLPATGIVWSADGVIVTSHHVVRRDENIVIGLPSGEAVNGTLVGRDETTDLAVLRVAMEGLTVPTWADDDSVRVGSLVLAVGRPREAVRAALGIIAVAEGRWRTPSGGEVDRQLHPDLVMYPGFSGGPLISATGQVIGLNTSALLRDANVTLPASTVKRVVESILAHGRVERGYLGVSTQQVRLPAKLATSTGQQTGLLLVAVEADSPAEAGGLLLGDTVIAIGERTVNSHDDLLAFLNSTPIGTETTVQIVRGGEPQSVTVTVQARQ